MRRILLPAALLLALAPTLAAQGAAAAAKPSAAKPAAKPAAPMAALKWGPAPAAFPAGSKMAVVSGDPSQAAMFTVQLSLPDGYKFPPHFHHTAEAVEVKKGTFLFAMGDTFDAAQLKTMAVGGKGSIPANGHHYAQAKGPTIVAVTAMGPFEITYVNAADDPRHPTP